MSSQTITKWQEKLVFIAENSSFKERESIECEREVEDMKMAEYMEDHIGEEYDGIIDSILNFGMFVCLPNMIEGLVRYENIVGDYFEFNEETNMLIGKRTGKKYKLGQKVRVKCISASKENSTIDFALVEGDKNGNSKQKIKI
jgi:ribonuclease R